MLFRSKNSYSNLETANIRIYARDKYWSPNIYSISSKESENVIIKNLFYKIVRIQDLLEVVPYGTGTMNHTRTSYDSEGNYFNFDMSLLERDYAYQIKFGYIYGDTFFELNESFKFRVE